MDDLNIQAGVTVNAEQAERAFTALGDKAQKMANEVTKAADKAGKATDGMGDGAEKGADKFTRAESRMRSAIQKSTRELEMLGKTASQKFEAQLEFKGLDKAKFQPFLDELRKTEEAAAKAREGVSGIGDAARVAGSMMAAAFSGAALLGMVGKVVAVQREFDVLNSSLKTVTGSSAAAEREMAWLKDFAKETPFGLAQATQGFVKMKALGLDPTRAALTSFGNTASAMGKDLNQMIEAVADASTGEFERLKEFGIKAKKEGDQVSLTFQGVTTTIKNSAEEITKYLENIGNTSFGGAMEERAKTLDGTIAALGDTWDELFRTVSTNNVGSLIFDSVTLANGALEDATTILRAMGGAAQDASRDTGALSTIQNGIATVFETVAVLGANLKYVLVQIGNEIGGLAAQVAQAARFNFAGVAAIRSQMVADAEAARKEIDATTERILNARKAQEEYARYATRNASAATDPRRVDLGGGTTRAAGGASSGAAKAAKEAISEYDKLIKKLSDELPAASAAAEAAQMGYNKAQAEFLALAASPAWAKFTNDQRATVAALFENKIAIEQSADAAKTLAKANIDAAASREKYIASLLSGLDKIKADTAAQIEATARMGLSKEAIAALDAAKLEMLATDLELQAIKAMDRNLDEQTYGALKQQAEAYRELAEAKKAGAAKEMALNLEKANQEAAKEAARDWERAAADINRSLTDALLRGFESGKSFAKNFRDTLKNMFNTLVLRPIISAVIQPVSMAVNGAVQGGLSALGGGSSLMGMAGNANTLAGFNTGWLTNFGATLPGSIASTGAQFYSQGFETLGNGLMDFGNSIAGYADALNVAGDVLGYGSAIFAAANGKWGQAIGSSVGTYFGGPIGSFIGSTIGKWADKIFSGGAGTPHTGGAGSYSAAGGQATGLAVLDQGLTFGVGERYYNSDAEKAAVGISQGIVQMLDSTAQSFGQQAGYFAATAFADDSSKDGAWGSLRIMRGDEKVLDWADTQTSKWAPKEFSDGEAGQKEYAAAIAASARDALKTALGDADWAKDMLDTLGDSVTLEGLDTVVAQINQAKAAFTSFGQYMPTFAGLAQSAVSAMVDAAGGVGPLSQGMATFVENFYSDAEKLAINTENVRAAMQELGFEMPETRDEFKALVQAQLALGDAGAKTAAGLLGLSGAFAAVTPAAESAQASIASVSDQLRDAFGMTAEAVSGILSDAVKNAETASEAQRMAAQAFEDKFYGGALDGLTDSLGAMIQSSVIAPMMESLVAGAAASSAALAAGGVTAASAMAAGGVAGASATAAGGGAAAGAMAAGGSSAASSMASGGAAAGALVGAALESARAQINAYSQILSDPAVQAGIKDISKLVGDVAGLTFDAQQSWGGGGGSFAGGGTGSGQAASEADKLAESLKNLGEAVEDEIKRLRGINTLDSDAAQATLLAQFATATAAARAGDLDAFGGLTDLSKSIEKVTAESAVTNIENVRMRAWLANSLEETMKALGLSVPAFAEGGLHSGGLRLVGERGWEVEATGPARYWNQQQLGNALGGGNAELVAEVRALRRQNAEQAADIARLNLRVARVLEGWEAGGMPKERTERWEPAV